MVKILVIDDDPNVIEFVQISLEQDDWEIKYAYDGKTALDILFKEDFDTIICDIEMPHMGGMQFLEEYNKLKKIAPVIMLTGIKDLKTVIYVMRMGAQNYLTKPLNSEDLRFAVKKSLEYKKLKEENVELLKEVNEYQKKLEAKVASKTRQLEEAVLGSLLLLAAVIEAKDPYTRGHAFRVKVLSVEIAKHLGLSEKDLKVIEYGALLHDVGKIGIRDSILLKDDILDEDEYQQISQHPLIGAKIIEHLAFYKPMHDIVKHHHERYDGGGYPDGLSGENIPLFARVVSVADTYDAITSSRPYRKAMTAKRAIEILEGNKYTQFDPEIVDVFVKNKIYNIKLSEDNNGELNLDEIQKLLGDDKLKKPDVVILDPKRFLWN